jgi:hypothetical protein
MGFTSVYIESKFQPFLVLASFIISRCIKLSPAAARVSSVILAAFAGAFAATRGLTFLRAAPVAHEARISVSRKKLIRRNTADNFNYSRSGTQSLP